MRVAPWRDGRVPSASCVSSALMLMGILGVVIVALMPETEAAKAARARRQYEAQVAAAQRQYEIQAEAARRAGYPFSPQQGPWQSYQDWQPPHP